MKKQGTYIPGTVFREKPTSYCITPDLCYDYSISNSRRERRNKGEENTWDETKQQQQHNKVGNDSRLSDGPAAV